jgi:hypothetical protein
MADVPLKLAWPLRFVNGRAATVEQDTVDEIAMCVVTLLRFDVGDRMEAPNFGVEDLTFRQAPLDLEQLRGAILEFEPRAQTLIEQDQDQLDTLIRIEIARRTSANG